jgi:hypothetical protein
VLPRDLTVLTLVENIKGPPLNRVVDVEWTQRDLDGVIVRCLFIVQKPTLGECFDWCANHPNS